MFAPSIFADDMSDVMEIIYQYGDLENDLEAQAKLMRSDRVFIAQGIRQTDEAKNMANQIAGRKASESLNGGKTEFVTTIEGPVVSIHGDVAVASFVRWWNVYPHNQGIKYERTDMGYTGPDQRRFRLAYQAHTPVTAPR